MANIMNWIQMKNPSESSFSNKYGFLSHNIFLIWNLAITAMVVYLVYKQSRVPLTLIATNPIGSSATDPNNEENSISHDAVIISTCVICALLIMIKVWWIANKIKRYLKKRSLRPKMENKTKQTIVQSEPGEEKCSDTSSAYKIEVATPEDFMKLKTGNSVRVKINKQCVDRDNEK